MQRSPHFPDRPTKKAGELHLICGPMFAGKTSELMRRIRRYRLCKYRCLVIRYAKDNRYSSLEATTHDGRAMAAVSVYDLESATKIASKHDVIGIDEGQFFKDAVPFCQEQIENGKIIIVAGLDATYLRTGFESILNLVPLAHTVEKLNAVCMSCGSKASFTKRIGNETEIEVIGGIDKYMAVCRECYKKPCPQKSSPFKRMENPLLSTKSDKETQQNIIIETEAVAAAHFNGQLADVSRALHF